MTKQELLDILENDYHFYEGDSRLSLLIKLIKGIDENDPDLSLVLEHETALQIIEFMLDCYNKEDFLNHLDYMDFDPFRDYRFSDYEYISDIDESERESAIENALFYNEKTGAIVHIW